MISSNMHECIFCKKYNIECGYDWALAICEDCKHHAQHIVSGLYEIRRVVKKGDTAWFQILEEYDRFNHLIHKVPRCQSDKNPRVKALTEISAGDTHSDAYKEATSQCEHPAFWVGSNGMRVCSHHKDGYVTFSNHFCDVTIEYDPQTFTEYGCANKATTTIDGLHLCKDHTPIHSHEVNDDTDIAALFTTPSIEEEQT